MKTIKKITLSITLLIIAVSCCENRVTVYHSSYFDKGQEIKIDIDDGNFKYGNKFKKYYSRDTHTKIKEICTKNDSIKIYFMVDGKDTTTYISSSTKKILLSFNSEKEINIYTENDESAWLSY